MDEGERAQRRIEAVDHALRVLLLLQTAPEVRVTTASQSLAIAPSTAHRILSTLTRRGFTVQDRVTKAYRAGPTLIELGVRSATSFDLRAACEPHLEALAHRSKETVNLLALEGATVRFAAGFEGSRTVRTHVLTGAVLPAYATSGGKVLLAELSRERLRELYPRGLRKLTPQTRTFTQLMDELALVMMRGYAFNQGESILGLNAVAVPVKDPMGRTVAAIALSAPSGRLRRNDDVREAVVALRGCAALIRADLARKLA